jgi:hypothetical protein
LRVGSWFGNWDLMISPLDDLALIFGKESLRFSKAVPFLHTGFLVFLNESKTPSMPMKMKRKLGRIPRMYAIKLIEGVGGSVDRPCNAVQQQGVS